MVEMIKRKTGCSIVVGQNGVVWIRGANSDLAAEVIYKIEQYAHKVGLTNKIEEYLDMKLKERSSSISSE
jgi:exosome complex component RRP4